MSARRVPRRGLRLGLCGALLSAFASSPVRPLPAISVAAVARILAFGVEPLFVFPGARDTAGIATLLSCTNFGGTGVGILVSFVDFNGTLDCQLSGPVGPLVTVLVATRDTAGFTEAGVCASPPVLVQGSVHVWAEPGADVICTAMVADAAGATPGFLTVLEATTR